ncbi:hypothetical protein SNEBB_008774 [Seison nebaliae]|nr:hypothetical protein SNEBB_008774 [Seison nebaliae]
MNKKKRQNINEQKEKHRTHNMNKAFHQLRSKLPDVPADTKLSKIKTLRLATQYIRTLLNATDPHKLKENDQEYYSNSIHFTENDQSSNNQSMNYYQLNDEDDSFFFFNSQSNLMQSLGRKRKRKSSNVSLEIDQKILKMSPTSDHLHDKKDGKQTNEKIYRVTTKQQGRETNKRNKLDGNIKGNQFVFDYDNQIETMKVLNEHFCQQELSIPNFSDLQSYHFDYSLNSLNPIPPNWFLQSSYDFPS